MDVRLSGDYTALLPYESVFAGNGPLRQPAYDHSLWAAKKEKSPLILRMGEAPAHLREVPTTHHARRVNRLR